MFLQRWFEEVVDALNNDKFRSELVESALSGNYTAGMPTYYVSLLSDPVINGQLLSATTHLERIKIIRPHFSVEEFQKTLEDKNKKSFQKDDIVAGMFLKQSGLFRHSSDFKMAIRGLNLATCFATEKVIGGIYRMRSLLHFELKNWESCLRDTERGLQMNCPDDQIEQLSVRRLKCELFMDPPKPLTPEAIAKNEFREKTMFQLHKGTHEKMPAASSVIEIRSDDKRGRGLFITENVEPGTTLLIEDPYVANVKEGLKWDMEHCWRCFKMIQSTIPCQSCVFAVYCSEQCRSANANGHALECKCLPYFHGTYMGLNRYLSYKAILKAGPEELYKLFKTFTSLKEIQATGGFDPKTGIYDSKAYLTSLALRSHVEDDGELAELVWAAISFTEYLFTKINFFAQVEESDKDEFKDFVASLALYHNVSSPINCLGLFDNDSRLLDYDEDEKSSICFALGVYPLLSLMNHSCDASVDRVNLLGGKVVIITSRALKAGEELLFCYGFDHAANDWKERQEALLSTYLFVCDCTPCKMKWPVYAELEKSEDPVRLRCPKCTDGFTYDQYEECALQELEKGIGKCALCENEFQLDPIREQLKLRAPVLHTCKRYIFDKNPVPAIRLLLKYIKYLQGTVCSPYLELCAAQRILIIAYSKVVQD